MNIMPENDLLHLVAFHPVDAMIMGIDYILITVLDFNGETQFPEVITFYIYSVDSGERIFERQIPGRSYRSSREEFEDLKAIARGIVPHIGR
jgi:hypothetical protein